MQRCCDQNQKYNIENNVWKLQNKKEEANKNDDFLNDNDIKRRCITNEQIKNEFELCNTHGEMLPS